MKSYIFSFLIMASFLRSAEPEAVAPIADSQIPATAFHIDSIQAVVFGQQQPQIITYSDLTRLSLSGEQRSLDDLVFESRVVDDAKQYKIEPGEAEVDKYLSMIQKQNNMSLDDLKNVFTSAGMTYEEGREQLRRMQIVQSMLDFKVRTQVIVPRNAVEEYYEAHPDAQEAEVTVKRGFLPYDEEKLDLQKRALAHMAKTGKKMKGVQWGQPFNLKESEVAEDKAFLFAMRKGDISPAKDIGIGFEVFRVLDASPRIVKTLDERYNEIADSLRKPIFEEMLEKYKKKLMDTASVLYLKPINPFAEK